MIFQCSGSKATKDWYAEVKDYDFNNPGFSFKTGHFTQVTFEKITHFFMCRRVFLACLEGIKKNGNCYGKFCYLVLYSSQLRPSWK